MTERRKFSALREQMTPERQASAQAKTEAMLAEMPLHALRQARNLSQETLAQALDRGQADVSKIERRADMYVSTLRRYVEAMGGRLDIIARFPDGDVRISQFSDLAESR